MVSKLIYRSLPILVLVAMAVIIFLNNDKGNKMNNSKLSNNSDLINSQRESITFILDEDEKGAKPYYSLAFDYYKTDKHARTENIVSSCRSLSEVRDYLKDNPPGNGRPWGLVNLVTHGNEWYGMHVPVKPGSKRSSAERLTEYVDSGKFESLSDYIIDDSTEIFLHGCGLGVDQELLKIVAKAFGGKGKRPMVVASKLKEYYFSVRTSNNVMKTQLYYANTWKVYYPFKKRPDNETLKQELIKLYPSEKLNWDDALKYTSPAVPSDVFHYEVNVPVYYSVKYNSMDSIPDLSSDDKKIKFIKSQKKFAGLIGKSKIPFEKFQWTTRRIYVKDEKNNKKPAISITGWCTVLCIVEPLIIEKNSSSLYTNPFFPAKTDTTYFGIN